MAPGPLLTAARSEGYGWHFVFLTVIGLALSTVTLAAGLLADITLSRRLFLVKNLLAVGSTPLMVLVTLLYWSLYMVRPRWSSISESPSLMSSLD